MDELERALRAVLDDPAQMRELRELGVTQEELAVLLREGETK